ncbi:MAG: GNAT family N-acetyltransferase [Bacteroidota bacterium]
MRIEQFSKAYDRSTFNSGNHQLDDYLKTRISQDIKRKISACFLLITDTDKIAGYYTLSSAEIPAKFFSEKEAKKLGGRYPYFPVTLLGRLAIDSDFKVQGLGKLLLVDALKRSHAASNSIGSIAVVVDPIDSDADRFYRKFGFIELEYGKLFLSMGSIAML